MGIIVRKRLRDLSDGYVLAPERYDPRRNLDVVSGVRLEDLVEIATDNLSRSQMQSSSRALVLDTTHAYEGFVIFKHEPVCMSEIGSARRLLSPGDVIISRLRPYLRQVAFVDPGLFELCQKGNLVVSSTEFFILRGRKGIESAGLVPFLLSQKVQAALAAGQEGGHHPRVSRELLADLRVPPGVVDAVPQAASQVVELCKSLRRTLNTSRELVRKADALLE